MKDRFFKKNWHLILFNILLLLIFIVFYGRFGDINIDCFREAYISQKVLEGKTLYSDIFTIYAPFSYLFNAILFWVFGVKLKVLYFAGFAASAGVLNLTYILAKKFIPKLYALGIICFIISVCVLSPNVFNFIFPYSYGILYGILFALGAILCCINKRFFWAYFLYSCAICSKYEFIFLIIPMIFYTGKAFWKYLPVTFIPVCLNIIPLIISGLKIDEIIFPVSVMFAMTTTKTFYWFYSVSGLIFRPQILLVYFAEFIKTIVPIVIVSRYTHLMVLLLSCLYLYYVVSPQIFLYTFPLILILFVFRYRKLNRKQKLVITSSLLVSMKVFFAMTFMSYGVFFVPFAILSIFILIPKRFKKSLLFVILICSFVFGVQNTEALINKTTKIETEKGVIYTNPYYGNSMKEFIDFVQTTDRKDRIIVYPESLAPNFLANRTGDSKMYSLIPLYTETFGEDFIIQRIKFLKPEYIAITNYDTSNYYYSGFGKDYALEILKYINDNYSEKKRFGENFSVVVYKLK